MAWILFAGKAGYCLFDYRLFATVRFFEKLSLPLKKSGFHLSVYKI